MTWPTPRSPAPTRSDVSAGSRAAFRHGRDFVSTQTEISGPPVAGRAVSDRSTPGRAWLRVRPLLLGATSVILLVVIWQVVTDLNLVKQIFLPTPMQVLDALKSIFSGGPIWNDLGVSGEEFIIGLGISIAIGAVLGILTGWYRPVDEFFKPIVVALNSMPQVAVIPVLILIFGIGITPKVIVVILSCAPVILMNTAAGVANVDERLMRVARSFGATDWQAIRTIVIPDVVPFFMTGLRISIGRAIIGVVVGEIFASRAGIGNLLISASDSFNMPVMYASVIIITALGILLTQVAAWAERRMQLWRT
jgi:ABC-type nitrate/sulfonate/bicarbonate transport system permease component